MLELLKKIITAVGIANFCLAFCNEILAIVCEILQLNANANANEDDGEELWARIADPTNEDDRARIAELDELDPDTLQGLAWRFIKLCAHELNGDDDA